MLVIPWVLDAETMQMGVDWHLLEDSKILSLKKMLKILLAGRDDWPLVLQLIKGCKLEFQTPGELLAPFPCWCFVVNGEITKLFDNFEAVVANLKAIDGQPFTVGWSVEGLAVVPTTKDFVDQIKTAKAGSIQITIADWYGIKIIK